MPEKNETGLLYWFQNLIPVSNSILPRPCNEGNCRAVNLNEESAKLGWGYDWGMKKADLLTICAALLVAAVILAFGPQVWEALTEKEMPVCIGTSSPAAARRFGCRLP